MEVEQRGSDKWEMRRKRDRKAAGAGDGGTEARQVNEKKRLKKKEGEMLHVKKGVRQGSNRKRKQAGHWGERGRSWPEEIKRWGDD